MDEAQGVTPLHMAASQGDIGALRAGVAEHGVEHVDGSGRTPLMYAVISNKSKSCRTLLKLGANVNARDDNGNTPLMWAACRGCRDAVRVSPHPVVPFAAWIESFHHPSWLTSNPPPPFPLFRFC